MKKVSICAGLALAFSCGLAHHALAQESLDVTMRVLDDVKDVDAVLVEIEDARTDKNAPDAEGERSGKHPDVVHDGGDQRETKDDDLRHGDGDLSRDELSEGADEHGDGKFEDHQVLEDLPAPSSDVPSDVVQ
jgi:hypothetical protein